MAKAARKTTTTAASKKATSKKASPKKTAPKKAGAKKARTRKNKLGVKNSLVNNINAKKKKGTATSAKKSTVSKESYNDMQHNWGKEK